jgi:hypothetical protein
MNREISIHEIAEIKINEAADFYDLVSPGLGIVFIEEVKRTMESISRFPDAAPSVRPEEIRILAVAHQNRRLFYLLLE